jgi:hypothetical protein
VWRKIKKIDISSPFHTPRESSIERKGRKNKIERMHRVEKGWYHEQQQEGREGEIPHVLLSEYPPKPYWFLSYAGGGFRSPNVDTDSASSLFPSPPSVSLQSLTMFFLDSVNLALLGSVGVDSFMVDVCCDDGWCDRGEMGDDEGEGVRGIVVKGEAANGSWSRSVIPLGGDEVSLNDHVPSVPRLAIRMPAPGVWSAYAQKQKVHEPVSRRVLADKKKRNKTYEI